MFLRTRVTLPARIFRRWDDAAQKFVEQTAPAIIAEVNLKIDEKGILEELGRKAILSKTGKAVEIGGLVEVKVISKREVSGGNS